jgi:hypothetical protein
MTYFRAVLTQSVNNVIDILSVLKPEGLQVWHCSQGICHFYVGHAVSRIEDLMLPQ